jgi:GH25 family lysozyme M1 (1,4-beta-N-acetylmuramidase)
MDIETDFEDNEVYELSRAQILEAANIETTTLFSVRGAAGLKRDFSVPSDFVSGFSYGIDVSHWQGQIAWTSVAAARPKYVYIKASQGSNYVDPRLVANIEGATGEGLPASCYHFLSANTGVQKQIDNFLRRYEPHHRPDRLPPCMDLEWDYNASGVDRWADKSSQFIADKSLRWLEKVETALGIRPIFYTNRSWWNDRLGADNQTLSDYGVWMSRYGGYGKSEPAMMSGYDWVMWQFTDRGSIAGIAGRIDVNLSGPGFPGSVGSQEPDEPYQLPDQPQAQPALSAAELASVYDTLRAKFERLSDGQVEHLKVLVNTSSPNQLRSIANGQVENPLSEAERLRYFTIAREVLGGGTLNQGQVDTLNILLASSSPTAVRKMLL